MAMLGTPERPLHVAIVGAGPSGFYAVKSLVRSDAHVRVDLFDRLPTPFGLVRAGVAPDHQTIKRVAQQYDKLATHEHVRFFGHVQLGRDLQAEDLRRRYDVVVYAVGCEGGRRLRIPGADLGGASASSDFVYWYNGHPDYQDRAYDLRGVRRVLVVGNGNVAVDVTRILAKPSDQLSTTDITADAHAILAQSAVTEIVVSGRRGPAQAAFTPKEIKELCHVEGVYVDVDPAELVLDDATVTSFAGDEPERNVARNLDQLSAQAERSSQGESRRVVLKFRISPVAYEGSNGRLTHVRFRRNQLVWADGRVRVEPTEDTWVEPFDMVLEAIGYRGLEIPGVPYEPGRGVIPNEDGVVVGGDREYVVGWAKRGPSGLLGHNAPDSASVVERLLADHVGAEALQPFVDDIEDLLAKRGAGWVRYEGWLKIDQAERAIGDARGKPREKFTAFGPMLNTARGADRPASDG